MIRISLSVQILFSHQYIDSTPGTKFAQAISFCSKRPFPSTEQMRKRKGLKNSLNDFYVRLLVATSLDGAVINTAECIGFLNEIEGFGRNFETNSLDSRRLFFWFFKRRQKSEAWKSFVGWFYENLILLQFRPLGTFLPVFNHYSIKNSKLEIEFILEQEK